MNRIFFILILNFLLWINGSLSAQWEACGGPNGSGMISFGLKDNTLFAGSELGKIYVSFDNGKKWISRSQGLPEAPIASFCYEGEYILVATYGKGIFISSDNGQNWIDFNRGIVKKNALKAITVKSFEGQIFTGTEGKGFYTRKIGDSSWSHITGKGLREVYSILKSGDNFLIGTNHGLYLSIDDGANWKKLRSKVIKRIIYSLTQYDNIIYAGTDIGIYTSTDNGVNWEQSSIELPPGKTRKDSRSARYYFRSIAKSGDVIYAISNNLGVFQSKDNGKNWSNIDDFNEKSNMTYSILAKDSIIFVADFSGIYRTNVNGPNDWVHSDTGINNVLINDLISYNNVLYAGTNYHGVVKSSDNGNTWHKIAGSYDISYVEALFADDSTLYSGSRYDGIYSYTIGDDKWRNYNKGLPGDYLFSLAKDTSLIEEYVQEIHSNGRPELYAGAFAGNADTLLFGEYAGGNLYISLNGQPWKSISDTFNRFSGVNSIILIDNQILIGKTDGFYKSSDYGKNWIEMNSGLKDISIESLVNDGSNIFAGTKDSGINRMPLKGEKWEEINNGLEDLHISSLFRYNGLLFAGTINGHIYISQNYGDTWRRVDNNFTNKEISSFAVIDDTIFVGTQGESVFKAEIRSLLK